MDLLTTNEKKFNKLNHEDKVKFLKAIEDIFDDGNPKTKINEEILLAIDKKLNDWYGRQGFDVSEKVTGVDIWNNQGDDEYGAAIEGADAAWHAKSIESKYYAFHEQTGDKLIQLTADDYE